MLDLSTNSSGALGAGGLFHQGVPGFVPRASQQEMALAVEDAINYAGKLVVESGTGTGKTYAYLVPVVLSGKKTIVSTATRHLQEQIFHRDLPVTARTLGSPVDAMMLKGRANYLCRYRLNQSRQQTELVESRHQSELALVERWATATSTGDIAEVGDVDEGSPVWRDVTATADNCLGGRCPDFERCFVNKARQRAMQADIVVVNHHLFFSDLTLKTEGFGELLPDHEVVVFDEAHAIPEIASRFFEETLSSFQFKDMLSDVSAAESEEKSAVDYCPAMDRVSDSIDDLVKRFQSRGISMETLADLQDVDIDRLLDDLGESLEHLHDALSLGAIAGAGLEQCLNRCRAYQETVDRWRSGQDSQLVRWLECDGRGFRMHITPVNVSHCISEFTNVPGVSWIFTSATLAVGESFDAYCNETGLQDAQTHQWLSPFDYQRNALLYLPPAMPDPRSEGFEESLVKNILEITLASKGRAFCLFTSHAMMNAVHRQLVPLIKWPLLVQGEAPKQQLVQRFLESDNAVLLGTASFWEGVDVRGQALSCVIIDKLPFASPSDPVLRSKLSNHEEQGGNPFMEIQLPDAVIALKQGAGRLIRSESDFGVLAICDPRILSKPYGRRFLASLPAMPMTRDVSEVWDFFRAHGVPELQTEGT